VCPLWPAADSAANDIPGVLYVQNARISAVEQWFTERTGVALPSAAGVAVAQRTEDVAEASSSDTGSQDSGDRRSDGEDEGGSDGGGGGAAAAGSGGGGNGAGGSGNVGGGGDSDMGMGVGMGMRNGRAASRKHALEPLTLPFPTNGDSAVGPGPDSDSEDADPLERSVSHARAGDAAVPADDDDAGLIAPLCTPNLGVRAPSMVAQIPDDSVSYDPPESVPVRESGDDLDVDGSDESRRVLKRLRSSDVLLDWGSPGDTSSPRPARGRTPYAARRR
jgi:hypothetical protein